MGQVAALVLCNLVLYTPARLFFYCDRISRLHWDCNRIEVCRRIVRIVGNSMAFERDLDRFLQWGRNVLDRVDCSGVMELSWNSRLYLVGIYLVSLGCVGTTTRVVKMRSWNPGAIGTPSWFYILRPVCSSIAPGFCDCARIA